MHRSIVVQNFTGEIRKDGRIGMITTVQIVVIIPDGVIQLIVKEIPNGLEFLCKLVKVLSR